MNALNKTKNENPIIDNKIAMTVVGAIIAVSLGVLFYFNLGLLLSVILYIITGCLGAFFIRRYGIWGKIITFFIYLPIFLIPKSVWKSIDEIEEKQKRLTLIRPPLVNRKYLIEAEKVSFFQSEQNVLMNQ